MWKMCLWGWKMVNLHGKEINKWKFLPIFLNNNEGFYFYFIVNVMKENLMEKCQNFHQWKKLKIKKE